MVYRTGCLLVVATVVAVCSGCAADAPRRFAWPWEGKSDDVLVSGPTPKERITELRALAKSAAEMAPPQQEAVSLSLAEQLAEEQDSIIRCEMLRTLGVFHTPTATAMVRAGLEDKDQDVQTTVCTILGDRGDPGSIQLLADTLTQNANLDVRLAAARALGNVKDQAAVQPLGLALDDPDPAVQRRAVESLRQVTGRDFGGDVVAWRTFVQGGEPARRRLTFAELWRRWL